MVSLVVHFLFLLLSSFHSLCLSASKGEGQALLKLKQYLTNSTALDSTWKPNSKPCSAPAWTGVTCNNGIMTGLHLSNLGLSGTIDVEALRHLPSLRTLSFANNNFSGPIPGFNKIGALKSLILTGNEFSGEIPKYFFSTLSSLKKVWLSGNKFSGNIPDSLRKLSRLKELHLESNQFTGPIPELKQNTITSLDFSNNKLQGQIPESLSRFDARSFSHNEQLCGKPLSKECNDQAAQPEPVGERNSNITKLIVASLLTLLAFSLIYIVLTSTRTNKDDFRVLAKENTAIRDPEQYQTTAVLGGGLTHAKAITSRNGGSWTSMSSQKGTSKNREMMSSSDLVVVNGDKGNIEFLDLMKAAAEVLGTSGLGSSYKAIVAVNGLSVVVKRMREANRVGKDEFEAEITRMGRLRHPNILPPLAYHYRRDEKLLVSEYVPKGSLLYLLHGDRGIHHAKLNWPTRLKIIQGIAIGMGFIHTEFGTSELPHGNLKSSNVLLDEGYEPLLSDYGFHSLINPNVAANAMFAFRSPEFIQCQKVCPKSDVYCLGIVILEIVTGKFPSQYLSSGKGGIDVVEWAWSAVHEKTKLVDMIDPEIAAYKSGSLDRMVDLLVIGAICTETDPEQRLDMREAIARIQHLQP